MYKRIKSHKTSLSIYGEKLINENTITFDEFEKQKSNFKNLLDQQFQTAKDYKPKIEWFEGTWSRYKPQKGKDIRGVSGFDTKELVKISEKIHKIDENLTFIKRYQRFLIIDIGLF